MRKNIRKEVGWIILAMSFSIAIYFVIIFILNYTNFVTIINNYVRDIDFTFYLFFKYLAFLGFLLFIISLILLKEIKHPIIFFTTDFLLLITSVVTLIGAFVSFFYWWFGLFLILISFIIYYAIHQIRLFQ